MTDDEHEAYGAMIHRGKAEASGGGMTTKDNALVEAMARAGCISGGIDPNKFWRGYANMMGAALAVARPAILEEVAKVADRHRSKIDVNEPLWHDGADWACDRIAEAIRALAKESSNG